MSIGRRRLDHGGYVDAHALLASRFNLTRFHESPMPRMGLFFVATRNLGYQLCEPAAVGQACLTK
ncbi:hypothetical protein [Sphingomonas ginkgonis]|uniref:hypothetical protein n=1 Tax=Sphingomonas ginkgonis TaxID=2315330 RepID=UPI000F883712|nr:hypothetical protein [Sphingomonas ginkgonis]